MAGRSASACWPPFTPSHWPKLAEMRPSVEHVDLGDAAAQGRPDPHDHVQSAATRACSAALGWMALTMVLPLTFVEGLGAVAGGAKMPGHVGLQVLVGQHAPPGSARCCAPGSRCWA